MMRRLHRATHARVIALAALIAAGLFALAIGRALGQPHSALPTSHHAAVTITRPATTLGGQIAPSPAAPTDAQHAGDGGGDHHGDGGDDGDN
jgi:hypothetical protein